ITPRTKWVVLNSPNNPSGAALGEGELCAIAEVIRRHPDLWVLSDDIYEHLIYDGFRFVTLAQVAPDLRERVLTVNGCSKAYAMTGWRVGFCGGPRALIRAMVNVQGQLTSGVCTVAQAAAAAALDGPQELVRQHAETYRRRRDLVVAMLTEAPGIACHRPEGAFYVYP
ncbi:MAG: aminotransferase class I/II-fold pyridoxal phosphate-dependent enzyme, partial [Oscillochloridaceae bacterium]|nr:aminotransferase class I/II-fold pyridoxal phosphate-dependent enzyme [Oscillochloridaceae bacterium]